MKHIHLSAPRTYAMRRAWSSGTGQVVRETRVASRSWSAPSMTPGPYLPSMVLIMTSVLSADTLCNAALERSSPWQRIPWTWRHWNHVWQGIKPNPHARPKCAEHAPNQTSWAWKYPPWHHQRLGPRHDHPIDHARSRQRPCQWWHCGGRKPGSTAATRLECRGGRISGSNGMISYPVSSRTVSDSNARAGWTKHDVIAGQACCSHVATLFGQTYCNCLVATAHGPAANIRYQLPGVRMIWTCKYYNKGLPASAWNPLPTRADKPSR